MTTTPAPTLPDEALERLRRQDAAAPAPGTTLTIAEVAERTGVSAHSLRYYERIGLLDVPRDPAGNRVYDERAYARVVFCSRLRMTGMPIRELQRYVAMVNEGEATEPDRLRMLLEHRQAVQAQIRRLQVALETIDFKIATYGGRTEP
ncbi:MAG TPA: MerR family transcriptional regulator [Pseudonocardia sp.]|jgi:DNA-binding transcriptional MerR regulator|uniref:MerR family transcriptional regulator n=1 Tax=Pseudonocardia sp. TaxID=60912 RepID=UPI002B4B6A18|nr:MerR family transcriptional regulator [Pseudonocardia sp.]HLU55856.1 MerR family transcriptional regulator [Pseudonocardia sp.]